MDMGELESKLTGELVRPGDRGWDAARQAWNLAAPQSPAAVAYVTGSDDAAAVIAFARDNDLRVASQGTGHGAFPLGTLDDALLVKTNRLDGIEVDAAKRVARVGAGVIWRDALNAAGESGLVGLAGSSPDVGVVGYTLGGGLSWFGRRYGLACNRVRAIDLVTADGEPRRVDAEHDPDLFWALRGGGCGLGIVTAMEFDLLPIPEIYAGSLILPADGDAGSVFRAYREWSKTVPDEVTSIARFLHLPPLPDVPEALRDRPLITLGACYVGTEEDGAELIAPLRDLREPVMDLFGMMPSSQIVTVHMEPEEPVPGVVHHTMLRELPEDAVDAFVGAAGPDSGSPLLLAELRHLGGALGTPGQDAGALAHLDADFIFLGVGMAMAPEQADPINRHLDAVVDALSPWVTGGAYYNFADRPADPNTLFSPQSLQRLSEIKASWDPQGVFHANHEIPVPA
jgi:FAD binding domain-containing protein/berberine-like enzyme